MNTQKGFASFLIILLGIVVIGGGVYVYDQKNDLGIFDKKEILKEIVPSVNIKPESEIKNTPDIDEQKIIEDKKNMINTEEKIVTELKSGTQTKISNSTSTTITLVGKDFQSTTTISKEEEEYFNKNTIYGCGNKNCFEENFKKCIPDNVSTNIGGFLGSTYYEIKGKNQGGCNVLFKYTEFPDPNWVDKEMICSLDNSLEFESATRDMFELVSSGELECKGKLYDILKPNIN